MAKKGQVRKVQITAEKHAELLEELKRLKNDERQKLADNLDELRDDFDGAEDVDLSDALLEKEHLEQRILEIEEIMHNAEILEPGDKTVTSVQVGCVVTVEIGKKKVEYTIVSHVEANPVESKISDESPVGKALIGHKEGETVVAIIGEKEMQIKILKITC